MSHSVAGHLSVAPAVYDDAIQGLIPGYETMLAVGVKALAARLPDRGRGARVVDLGTGTGAFAHRIALALPEAQVHAVDVDASMLAQAEERLRSFGARVTFEHAPFDEALAHADADAFVASLSLHHVRVLGDKGALYRHVRAALRPGGVFVNADATMHAEEPFVSLTKSLWADHLAAHGHSRDDAFARFQAWEDEDTYFGAEVELGLLRAAGFSAADILWRAPPVTVLVAIP